MKTFSLFTFCLALFALAGPSLRAADTRADDVSRLASCLTALQGIQNDPATAIPAAILRRAHALAIVHQVKAGFFLGIKGGYGVILVKKSGGQWSVPGFLSTGNVSFGLQIGAQTVDTVYVFLDDQTPRRLFTGKLDFGADAKAVAGPHDAGAGSTEYFQNASVLVYSNANGLFAGAAVNTGYLTPNDKANRTFYQTDNAMPEILYSDWITPPAEVQPLMGYVSRISGGGQ